MDIPNHLKTVFTYVNARPTETTWRRIVLGSAAKLYASPGVPLPEIPTYGIESLEELHHTLEEFRQFLLRWTTLRRVGTVEGRELRETLKVRSNLQLVDIGIDPKTKRVFPVYKTDADSFSEMLYSELRLALEEVSPAAIHRCDACQTFFYDPSKRKLKYCSKRCRNVAMARRYRERNPEEHRKYQRDLMRRLREQGRASS